MKDWFHDSLFWLLSLVLGSGMWIVRNILTNNKRIALLEQSLENHYKDVVKEHKYLREAIEKEANIRTEEIRENRQVNQKILQVLGSKQDRE